MKKKKSDRRTWDASQTVAAIVSHRVLKTRQWPEANVCNDRLGFVGNYRQCLRSGDDATFEQKETALRAEHLLHFLGGSEYRDDPKEYMLGSKKREYTILDLVILTETNGDRMGKHTRRASYFYQRYLLLLFQQQHSQKQVYFLNSKWS